MEAYETCVRSWLASITSALQDSSDISLDVIAPQPVARADDRQVRLAATSMSALPVPLQTLLKALSELKQDISKERIRQHANYENKLITLLESRVTYTCKSLRHCADQCRDAIGSFCDKDLEEAVEALGPCLAAEWHLKPQIILRQLNGELHKTMLSNVKRPVVRAAPEVRTEQAYAAVQSSQRLRERLRDLAQGPLKSLFEPVKAPEEPAVAIDSDVTAAAAESDTSERDILIKIKEAQNCARSVARARERHLRARDLSINDALSACAVACAIEMAPSESFVFGSDADMSNADDAIQNEIRYLLETLTVDRAALDTVLRSIRAQCDTLNSAADAESSAAWSVRLYSWKLHLEAAYSALRDA